MPLNIHTHTHTHTHQQPNTDIVLGAAEGTNSFIHDRLELLDIIYQYASWVCTSNIYNVHTLTWKDAMHTHTGSHLHKLNLPSIPIKTSDVPQLNMWME